MAAYRLSTWLEPGRATDSYRRTRNASSPSSLRPKDAAAVLVTDCTPPTGVAMIDSVPTAAGSGPGLVQVTPTVAVPSLMVTSPSVVQMVSVWLLRICVPAGISVPLAPVKVTVAVDG